MVDFERELELEMDMSEHEDDWPDAEDAEVDPGEEDDRHWEDRW